MSYLTVSKALAVSCAIAAAAACNSSNRGNVNGNADANGTADRTASDIKREPRPQPINVTGCLQQGSGHGYILTRLNEPSQKSVGTSGAPGAVEREQLREAASAYRIDPQVDVKLDDMIGKQIRVSGMLTARADLPKPESIGSAAPNRDERGTTGAAASDANRNTDRADITQGDLAKIDATSVTVVADACGDQAKSSKTSKRKK
jgi:hypothetical protein